MAGIILLYSCAPSTYVHNSLFTPLFGEKGEMVITSYFGPQFPQIQAGYSLTDHIGIVANGVSGYGAFFGEAGMGYFGRRGDRVRFEAYGGFGKGNTDVFTKRYDVDAVYFRSYLQPAIAYRLGEHAFMGIAVRASYLQYERYKYFYDDNLTYPLPGETDTLVVSDFGGWIADPVFFIRAGGQYVNFTLQTGANLLFFERRTAYQRHPVYFENVIPRGFLLYFGLTLTLPVNTELRP